MKPGRIYCRGGGNGGSGYGGATINTGNGSVTIVNATFSGNGATGGNGGTCGTTPGCPSCHDGPGSAGGGYGGALYNNSAKPLAVQNSIVANSTSGGNANGTITDIGNNISSDGTCNFTASGSLNNTNPQFSGYANHGGLTYSRSKA